MAYRGKTAEKLQELCHSPNISAPNRISRGTTHSKPCKFPPQDLSICWSQRGLLPQDNNHFIKCSEVLDIQRVSFTFTVLESLVHMRHETQCKFSPSARWPQWSFLQQESVYVTHSGHYFPPVEKAKRQFIDGPYQNQQQVQASSISTTNVQSVTTSPMGLSETHMLSLHVRPISTESTILIKWLIFFLVI